MLDSETKRRIDTLRDILVGRIPNPQSQVEQITTGLIYKFMNDMDEESIELGGDASFFVGDYEKYAWKHLLDSKLGGVDRVNIYSEAIEKMYFNPSAPQLFRDIFKNVFLPFKDPSTLNMFLKEIDQFHYSHSEKLGDAFEYLISIMGSQGDAGQFRTPRHIIDFIVEIVNPQKDETILDPACGTAGFLISSYKHILKSNTNNKLGDQLSAEDRKKVGENLSGYDISPEMVRLSLVNMYLNSFKTPKVDEYDTLSSEDKWNEYYDVILANPPFFSPKGGIQPHNRFGVESKRAEVLFTSYILDHLKPNGRAGIIVPEGIIFQTGKAYKKLRKQLIETALIGVISLPAGVFNPYSGVKTSILILDKKLSKERDSIFFANVKNDGFSLGAQRTSIKENDLPEIANCIHSVRESNLIQSIEKTALLEDQNVGLSGKVKKEFLSHSKFDLVKIDDVVSIQNGFAFKSENYQKEGFRVIRITNVQNGRIEDSNPKFYPKLDSSDHEKYLLYDRDILISLTGNVGRVGRLTHDLEPAYLNQRVCKLEIFSPTRLLSDYLFWILNSKKFESDCIENSTGMAQKNLSTNWIKEYEFPLPPLEVQQEIVDELEGYQIIIDGCKQVVENYKPTIDIDPSWEIVELGEIGEIISGGTPKSDEDSYWEGDIKWLTLVDLPADESISYISDSKRKITELGLSKSSAKLIPSNSVIVSSRATIGRVGINLCAVSTNQGFKSIVIDSERYLPEYIATQIFLKRKYMQDIATGGTFGEISKTNFIKIKIPIPSLETQKEIVQKLEEERKVIEGNKKLIEVYTQKIKDRINKVWGE